jgi:hypothetical protein
LTQPEISKSEVRSEVYGSLALGDGLVILPLVHKHTAQERVGERKRVIESNGLMLQLESSI